ncbi:hypothetical protein SASPL_112475 [Salvia splendens]|uniref:7-hydroxymethyl chlorophyll a reductase n=1 Tax=Salvia splendens TaxID=180675 RepID=A0A8X8YAU0_SALSN|nr:hypothetical protein SASPL_112475 [Salvia splendens]
MASAQVLKKQEHLEAGKKKLEEFRRKRAAKKASSTNVINEKQPPETENVRATESNGVGTSDTISEGRPETSNDVPKIADKEYDIPRQNDFISSSDKNATSSLLDRNNVHSYSDNEEYRDHAASVHLEQYQSPQDKFQSRKDEYGTSVEIASGLGKYNILANKVSSAEENHASSYLTSDGLDKHPSNDIHRPEKDVPLVNSSTSSIYNANFKPKNFVSSLGNSRDEDFKLTTPSFIEPQHSSSNISGPTIGLKENFSVFSGMEGKKFGSAFNHSESTNNSSLWTSDNKFADYNSEALSSSNCGPPSPPTSGRRTRPSFLDSIQISKGPSSSLPLFGTEKDDVSSSKVYPVDGLGSSVPHRFTNTPVSSGDGAGLFNITEQKHDFFSQKQNEDFAALEQHIEDLTQERFSLQRALESSRALAESLASENSALTDSFNQQGTVVNQLKFDLERLQEEIKAQLIFLNQEVELDAVKMEYSNVLLECNAADERAKLLASEVIALEEKALRLRSNELKLERELENSQAEIYSYRKRMSSLEKDRQDLQSTIDALQEDTNTTTESAVSASGTVWIGDEDPRSQFSPENVYLNLESLPVAFPSDQIRMIQNINTLIVELSIEKDQLVQALSAESSQSSKLLELNKELTRKLEAQTQRLELLMAQSMANDNNQPRHQNIQTVPVSITYADEGDEVMFLLSLRVSRVLPLLQQRTTYTTAMAAGILHHNPFSLSIVSQSSTEGTTSNSPKLRGDWRQKSRPIPPGGTYPAKDHCSRCGLCDTYYIAHVKNACAFLGDGMSRIEVTSVFALVVLEPMVHGRGRKIDSLDETYMGVYEDLLYARKTQPVEGAQWTGIVTTIAMEMLRTGMVEAVVCVQSDPEDRFTPRPVLARTPEEVLAAKGVKPTLSPNLDTLALVEAAGVKRLLFCGVGCQVQALRSVEHHLNLEKLYVLGTNCVDNGTREGLDKFLKAASTEPETVLHYEFMQDYKVHLKHLDGHIEEVPYFSLPANELTDVIAPSCYSCFDYTNGLADLVVGYMGVPKYAKVSMTQHPQYVTVRNERGKEMLNLVKDLLEITPTISSGNRHPFVTETVKADDNAKLGKGPSQPAPKLVGDLIAFILNLVGPKGLEFARYSLDYHTIRNYLHVNRTWGKERAEKHMPSYAKKLVSMYNQNGEIDEMLSNK